MSNPHTPALVGMEFKLPVRLVSPAAWIELALMFGMLAHIDPCSTCIEAPGHYQLNECSSSKYPCGHHCNCSWYNDSCTWCGALLDEEH